MRPCLRLFIPLAETGVGRARATPSARRRSSRPSTATFTT